MRCMADCFLSSLKVPGATEQITSRETNILFFCLFVLFWEMALQSVKQNGMYGLRENQLQCCAGQFLVHAWGGATPLIASQKIISIAGNTSVNIFQQGVLHIK